ncbi:fumarylacetoacetate hydrolase family protein [Nakamurella aerolata]|uniref:Fumarylacetoacetate hydrolase family protein n=1 Tax=Nakamurella aerolata TaxID=1656892 RepID=A0A849ABR4_9ACTN|nr:fumarylacetoacetate hydrolase family protein [Nakamurella aerolata]NNG36591.1 fumarylacetoacetate hydrolase family protein [Nakamurella aerolata]
MRLARVAHPEHGVAFVTVDSVEEQDPAHAATGGLDPQTNLREILAHPFGTPEYSGREWKLGESRLLAPILPSKIIAFGRTYADHAAELGNQVPDQPLCFLKPSTAVIGPGAAIVLPPQSKQVSYEGELAVVIGRPCKDVPAEDVASVILGYTVGNDVTARDLQTTDGQWARAKGFDTFCPLGPWIETDLDSAALTIRTEIDGEVRQDGTTADMVFTIGELIEWISAAMTLLPGDVILTGTPQGVGLLESGQQASISVEGIGTLSNPVR